MSGSRRPATAPGRVSYDDGVLRISRRAGARLVLAGEIDEETYPALVSSLGEVAAGAAEVHIDLSAVRYCDLAGLRAMIRLAGPGGAASCCMGYRNSWTRYCACSAGTALPASSCTGRPRLRSAGC